MDRGRSPVASSRKDTGREDEQVETRDAPPRFNVLVTGATGFIGRAVCRTLAAQGHKVRAGSRKARRGTAAADGGGIQAYPLDLDRAEPVRAAVEGMDAIVHAAYGRVDAMPEQLARLLDAASAGQVPRLVHFSSIAVYGNATGIVDEQTPAVPPLDAYGTAKIQCEQLLQGWARPGRIVTALRPGIVYGPHSPFWNDKIEQRIRAGAWGTFGTAGEGTAALVHVDDVVDAVAAALTRSAEPSWLALNITGPQAPSWNAYFQAIADALGSPLPPIGAPALARARSLVLFAKVWRRLGLSGLDRWALAPTAGELALFARHATYPNALARQVLGWTPQRDFHAELRSIHGAPAARRP